MRVLRASYTNPLSLGLRAYFEIMQLTSALSIPGADFVLEKLVNLWNYHIALEDYSVMQGQAHNVDDLGANHLSVGDLGDE